MPGAFGHVLITYCEVSNRNRTFAINFLKATVKKKAWEHQVFA